MINPNLSPVVIKSCPFCQSMNTKLELSDEQREDMWFIACSVCEALGPTKEGQHHAIDAWNRRGEDAVPGIPVSVQNDAAAQWRARAEKAEAALITSGELFRAKQAELEAMTEGRDYYQDLWDSR